MDEKQIQARRREICVELMALGPMRRGCVIEQEVESVHPDGTRTRRGPYPLLTMKEKGKTVSRRLKDDEEVRRMREEIARFRRFEELTAELRRLGEALCALVDDGVKKKRRRSPSSGTRR